jgi:predicted Zn-dependent peptidase
MTSLPDHLTSLVVPTDQQDAYLDRHHLVYKKLNNGATIQAASGRDPNSTTAEVDFSFATGSYFDRPDTIGELHFLEHLINKPLRTYAESVDVGLNASTSYYNMSEHMTGTLAPDVPGYGLGAITEQIVKRLHNPTAGYDNLEETVDSEREIIKNEIDRNRADHSWHARHNLLHDTLAAGNPLLSETAGTHASLDNIDGNVLAHVAKQICTAPLMTAHIYNHGDPKALQEYVDTVSTYLESFPTSGLERALDWTLLDRIQSTHENRIHTHSTGLQNNYASIIFVWDMEALPFSIKSTAINLYTSYLHEKVHKYAREQGIGYMAYAQNYGLFEKKLFVIQFDTSNKNELQLRELQKKIEGEMATALFDDDMAGFAHITQKAKKRQLANPLGTEYTSWLLDFGLEHYGVILDAERVRGVSLAVTAEDIKECNDYLRSTAAPVISITGDI